MQRFASLKILTKMLMICGVFVTPVGLPTIFLIRQTDGDLAFATSEKAGSTYLETVWPFMNQLATNGFSDSAKLTELAQPWREMASRNDGLFDSSGASKTFSDAIAAGRQSVGDALADGRDLIAKVADGSKLILDPVLDSYYVMDAVVDKAPTAIAAAGALTEALGKHDSVILSFEAMAGLIRKLGEFDASVAGFDESLAKAIAGNTDGLSVRELGPHRKTVAEAALAFSRIIMPIIRARAQGIERDADSEALAARAKTLTAALDGFAHAGNRELQRLLDARINRLSSALQEDLAIICGFLVMAGALVALMTRSITGPIKVLIAAIERMRSGDFGVAIPFAERKNEIGAFAQALMFLRNGVILIREADMTAANQDQERMTQTILNEMVAEVGRATGDGLDVIVTAADEMADRALQMQVALQEVERASNLASVQTRASHQMTDEATQLSSSMMQAIADVGSMVEQTTESTRAAVNQASAARERMTELAEAARDITSFVSFISAIASQTNLLALNATIEAARAGEMGRGFAVVAGEVKVLAAQTTKSSDQISEKVDDIQRRTQVAIESIAAIVSSIEELLGVSAAINEAMREQHAMTGEFARIVERVNFSVSKVDEQATQIAELASKSMDCSLAVGSGVEHMKLQTQTIREDIPRIVAGARDRIEGERYELF